MEKKKVCIVGGGAAGMIAAIMAARNHAAVTILEHNEKTGKKLLATGNGRCNLTNEKQEKMCYHSEHPELLWDILQNFPFEQTLDFLKKSVFILFQKMDIFTLPVCRHPVYRKF